MTTLAPLLPLLPELAGCEVVLDAPDTRLTRDLLGVGADRVQTWEEATQAGAEADLVVLHGPDALNLVPAAATALRPGGTVILLVPTRHPGRAGASLTPAAGERWLRQAGLEPHTTHGLRPHPDAPGFLVPLSPVNALRHFAGSLHRPWSTHATLLSLVLARGPRTGLVLLPFLLFRARRPGPAHPSWTDELVESVREHLPGAPAAPLGVLLIDSGARGATTLLLHARDRAEPLGVVKIAATDDRAAALRHEFDALRRLGTIPLGDPWADSVPRPLALLDVRGRRVLLESGVPGQPLTVRVRRRLVGSDPAGDLARPLAWLSALQRATTGPGAAPGMPSGGAAAGGTVVDPQRCSLALDRRPPGVPSGTWARFARAAGDSARSHAGLHVPTVLTHGDLWPGNVLLRAQGRVGVLDWEASDPAGSPLTDPLFLVLTYLQVAHTRGTRAPSLGAVLADHLLPRPAGRASAAMGLLRGHVRSLGLPAAATEALLALELGARDLTAPGWPRTPHVLERSSA